MDGIGPQNQPKQVKKNATTPTKKRAENRSLLVKLQIQRCLFEFSFACSLGLLLAFHRRLFIMLSLADLSEDAGTGTRFLPSAQGAVQGFIVFDSDF